MKELVWFRGTRVSRPGQLRALRDGPHWLRPLKDKFTLPLVDRTAPISSETRLTAEQVTAIAKVMADPRRFAILQQIASQQELACTSLNVHDCLSPATISHHLKELQIVGLVVTEREGRGMRLMFQRPVWEAYLRELATL